MKQVSNLLVRGESGNALNVSGLSLEIKILIDWLAEVEVKLRSQAVREICVQARDPKGTAAAKWIAEGKYNARKAGKPSNAEVEKQAKIQARIDDEVEDDIARVMNTQGLKLVEVK